MHEIWKALPYRILMCVCKKGNIVDQAGLEQRLATITMGLVGQEWSFDQQTDLQYQAHRGQGKVSLDTGS